MDLEKIDKLRDEMNDLEVYLSRLTKDLPTSDVDALNNKIGKIKAEILSFKQVTADIILKALPRLIRDISSKYDKKISVELIGHEIQVDRPILEMMSDILVILIQNSIIHGIESAEERIALHKDIQGKIKIIVAERENSLIFCVEDDGKGLDPKILWSKGIEAGLIDKHEEFDIAYIEELVFLSGFSTAETKTTSAGRGVGLSSVKKALKIFNGTISFSSKMNEGTIFTVSMPKI